MEEEEDFRLQFIHAGLMKTPELSVLEARKEIVSFSERLECMFAMVREMLHEHEEEKSVKLYARIEKYENICDRLEQDIAQYLGNVSNAHLSDDTKGKIRSMLREIGELESVSDACYNIARVLMRKQEKKEKFTAAQENSVDSMMNLVSYFLTHMTLSLKKSRKEVDMHQTYNLENELNSYRDLLKSNNIIDLNEHRYNYASGSMYMDIVNECEKLGDYIVNVVEARFGK